ncbi:entericidin A/B family lipoprotein [Chromohalobacter nigrandesensis]|nr:entericidin A/B family lipoprotein [Chromohalobacter nigrandesensis]MCK0745498.1 entericidin A/B family lipoprotein [Chromohalobacter nigrandesensis]
MKRTSIAILGLLLLAVLSGCNTIHGAGEDIERGGEAIQNAATN